MILWYYRDTVLHEGHEPALTSVPSVYHGPGHTCIWWHCEQLFSLAEELKELLIEICNNHYIETINGFLFWVAKRLVVVGRNDQHFSFSNISLDISPSSPYCYSQNSHQFAYNNLYSWLARTKGYHLINVEM